MNLATAVAFLVLIGIVPIAPSLGVLVLVLTNSALVGFAWVVVAVLAFGLYFALVFRSGSVRAHGAEIVASSILGRTTLSVYDIDRVAAHGWRVWVRTRGGGGFDLLVLSGNPERIASRITAHIASMQSYRDIA